MPVPGQRPTVWLCGLGAARGCRLTERWVVAGEGAPTVGAIREVLTDLPHANLCTLRVLVGGSEQRAAGRGWAHHAMHAEG